MMLAVFAAMFVALMLGWLGRRGLAMACIALCLGLAIWEFLFEIYSPETGFGMPWIQVRIHETPAMPWALA